MYSNISRRMLHGVILSSFMLALIFPAAGTQAHGSDDFDIEPGVTRQDERAAQAADIAILARETGLPAQRIERALAFQQAFAAYADRLLSRYPDQISAVWAEPLPNTRGHVQFTAAVPAEVTAEIESLGVLEPHNLAITGDGQISMADHIRRAELAAAALGDLAYQETVTLFDPIDNVIRIELQLPAGAMQPRTVDLVGAVQNRVRADRDQHGKARLHGRAGTVAARDLELKILTGSGPMLKNDHSRGGNWLLDDGVEECTSSWSVHGSYGDGILTAGHCDGLNQFKQPGVAPYDMTFRTQVHGAEGDVQYQTTAHEELPEFYATSTDIRDLISIQPTNTMVGGRVCLYGRKSNDRRCFTVEAIGVTATLSGVTVSNLARTDSTNSIPGDSGGGWSFNNTAWGINRGHDSAGHGYFTPIQQALSALNVALLCRDVCMAIYN
jgi:hypothetical protein